MKRIKVPIYAKKKAKQGLAYRKSVSKYKKPGLTRGQASKLGIASGVERAYQLKNNETISETDAKKIARFYARFKNKKSKRAIEAVNLWGGKKLGKKLYKKFYK